MNYIHHLNHFLKKVEESETVCPTHISLYMALFHLWNQHHFQSPIAATRIELMHVSKISSKTTFHKCIKDLVEWKWIEYSPSTSIYRGSSFRLFPFSNSPKNGPANSSSSGTRSNTSNGIANEPEMVSYKQTDTNHLNLKINKSKNKNYDEEL